MSSTHGSLTGVLHCFGTLTHSGEERYFLKVKGHPHTINVGFYESVHRKGLNPRSLLNKEITVYGKIELAGEGKHVYIREEKVKVIDSKISQQNYIERLQEELEAEKLKLSK
jgi:hypothetical protein